MINMMQMLSNCANMSDEGARTLKDILVKEAFKANNIMGFPKITRSEDRGRIYYTCNIPARMSSTGKRKTFKAATVDKLIEKVNNFVCGVASEGQESSKMTVQDAVEAKIDAAKDGVKIQTYERYKRMFRNHIQDTRFGNMKLEDVRASECEAFIQTLYQKNLGYGSVKHLKSLVSMTFDYAVSHGYMRANYMKAVRINQGLCIGERQHESGAWTTGEINKMWDACLDSWHNHRSCRHIDAVMLGIYTGARIGEILALTWNDVDMDAGTISINKTAIRYTDPITGKKTLGVNSTKTVESRRVIDMNEAARFWMNEIKLRNEELGFTGNLVIQSKIGGPVKTEGINACLRYFCERYSIPYHSSHAARRSYATVMIDSGIPIHVVSRELGHTDIRTTQSAYYKPQVDRDGVLCQKNAAIFETVGNRLKQTKTA